MENACDSETHIQTAHQKRKCNRPLMMNLGIRGLDATLSHLVTNRVNQQGHRGIKEADCSRNSKTQMTENSYNLKFEKMLVCISKECMSVYANIHIKAPTTV
jgi:hypothetical protein